MVRKKQVIFDFNAALAHLRDEQTTLSPTTLAGLSRAGKNDIATFAQTWTTLSTDRRRRASQMLVDMAEENFEHDFNLLFRYMLNDEDARVRARAIDGLWEDEEPTLIKPLIGYMRSDPDPVVRATAADALGRFVLLGEYGRLPQPALADLVHDALLATIRSGTEELAVRARAIESLAYWSDDSMREIIAAAYEDEDAQMRASAVSAMGRSADTYWSETAAAELESPDPVMRFEAARAAGELENKAAVPRLIEMLEDEDREIQGAAISALGQIGGKPAREALTQAANSKDEVLRSLADEALQELDFASSSDLLLMDLTDEMDELALDEWDSEPDPDSDRTED